MELTKEYFDQQLKNLATKKDLDNFVTKEDAKEFATKADINRVLTAVDGIAKQMQTYNEELPAIQQQLRNINDWIKQASPKIGVEYKS
jgi:hypothetical protein